MPLIGEPNQPLISIERVPARRLLSNITGTPTIDTDDAKLIGVVQAARR